MAIAVFVIVMFILGRWIFGTSSVQTTNDAYINADFTLVAPKISGFVEQILVQDNQQVKSGQVLARIDAKDYEANLAAANAAVAIAHANADDASAALVRQQALILQAKSIVNGDISQVAFSRQELARYQNLAKQGAGTLQNYQLLQSRLQTALAKEAEHRAAIKAVTDQLNVITAQREAALAQILHAQAMQQRANLDLSYTTLVAPFDGTVGRRSVRVGAYVKPGDLLMAVVPSLRPILLPISRKAI